MGCEHRTHYIEVREHRSVILCDGCGTQLAGWRIDVTLPFFLLEQADDEHLMWHLWREREDAAPQGEASELS